MDKKLTELEKIISMQESYFENLIKLGLLIENSGQTERAFDIYKPNIMKADKANHELSFAMLGLKGWTF